MKAFLSILFLSCFVFHCNAQSNHYFPPAFSSEWETLSIDSLDWCQDRVDDMVDFVEENNSKGFIILKDGRIVVEEYFGEFTADSLWYWASAGKTLTGFLLGMAEENGDLNLDDPTSDYLGLGWTTSSPEQEAEITVWNQITMTTGLDDSETFNCQDPECLFYLTDPGERWAYHNAPYTLTQDVLVNATGAASINSYLLQNLSPTTGITGAFVPVNGNSLMFSTPRSFARFGQLLLNEGNWNGTNLLGDGSFFNDMITPSQDLNKSYGYLTWLNGQDSYIIPGFQIEIPGSLVPNAPDDMFSALGKNDQIIDVVPSMGLVIIRMGDLADNDDLVPVTFNNELWEHINGLECENSVQEIQLSKVSIYPNPSSVQLNITGVSALQCQLLDSSGRIVLEIQNSNSLDVSDLTTGIYTLRIYTEDQFISKKVAIH